MKEQYYRIFLNDSFKSGTLQLADKNRLGEFLEDGDSLKDWEPCDLILEQGEYCHYHYVPGINHVVSRELMEVLRKYIVDQSLVDFIPIKTASKKFGDRIYYIVHFNRLSGVIDEGNSRKIPETGYIVVPCVDYSKAFWLDVFNSMPIRNELFVSDRVKREIIKSKLNTGMQFYPTLVSNYDEQKQEILKKAGDAKIGDIFCAEIDGKFKCYFQYIAKDSQRINSSIIRVFNRRYAMDYEPVFKDIVNDDILFYAHTVLRPGVDAGVWSRVGKCKELGLAELKNVYFGTMEMVSQRIDAWSVGGTFECWRIWKVDEPAEELKELPNKYLASFEIGAVLPYECIVGRMKYGYYRWTFNEYDVLRRVPREDVDSYVKHEFDGVMHYFHFYGADAVREIVAHGDDVICRLDKEHSRCGDYELRQGKFWETNWLYRDFITEEEFEAVWNKLK